MFSSLTENRLVLAKGQLTSKFNLFPIHSTPLVHYVRAKLRPEKLHCEEDKTLNKYAMTTGNSRILEDHKGTQESSRFLEFPIVIVYLLIVLSQL